MGNEGGLSDRDAAIDALVRFAIGLDDGDAELLTSSLTPDTVMDLTPFNKIGMSYTEIVGRDIVVPRLIKAVGPLDSTHALSNFRVKLNGDKADLSCYVLAQHFRPGEGSSVEDHPWYMMGNRYTAEVVRSGELWQISRLVIHPAWTTGDLDVMKVS